MNQYLSNTLTNPNEYAIIYLICKTDEYILLIFPNLYYFPEK